LLYITRVGANWFVSWSWLYPQHKHGKKREKTSKNKFINLLNNKSCRTTLVYIFFLSCLSWLSTVYVTIQTNQNLIKPIRSGLCWPFKSQTMVNSCKTLKLLAWILRCAGFISWWVSLPEFRKAKISWYLRRIWTMFLSKPCKIITNYRHLKLFTKFPKDF
jgi:hypothetical protein